MKKRFWKHALLFWISCFLMGCARLSPIPEGSRSLGVYEGSFDGMRYDGTIRVHLFQTPEGENRFSATVAVEPMEPTEPRALFVLGDMTENALEGTFQGAASGTFGGRRSSDGTRLSGSFNITSPGLNQGTWQARKK